MRKNLLWTVTVLAILFANLSLRAQSYSWSYHENAGNPGGINTESDAPGLGTWTNILTGPTSTNQWSSTVSIPFEFKFYGTLVTQFKASANGLVTFDVASNQLTDTNFALPSDSIPNMTIAGFWDEFTAGAPTASGDDIRWNVFGTAPNRQLWIKWYSFEMGNPTIGFVYNSVVLEESTNNIYVVDQYSTTTASVLAQQNATVGLQFNSTQFIQANDTVDLSGNGTATTDNDYYQFTYYEDFDLGITAVLNPETVTCPATEDVILSVKNFGIATIDSATIQYSLNGSTPVSQTFTALDLDTFETVDLNLGAITFTGANTLEIIITSVNGVTDSVTANDTVVFNFTASGLSGIYTIDGASATSGTNFQTFSDAATALNSFGVCGSVVFNVAAGTYSENILLNNVLNVSETNSISFIGTNELTTILTHDGTTSEATWQIVGTDHINIKHLTIATTKTTADAWGLHLSGGCDSILIDSCRFPTPVTTTTDIMGIVASNLLTVETSEGDNVEYLTIRNSWFRGGESGVHIEGPDPNYSRNIEITGCTFLQHDDQAFEVDNIEGLIFNNNYIDSLVSTGADGVYLVDVNNYEINGNNINVDGYGIYVNDGNDAITVATPSEIINNMIISASNIALYLNDFESTNTYHNSVAGEPAIQINDQTDADIRNNIFYSATDYAFESLDALTTTDTVDYNLYFSGSSNMYHVGGTNYPDLATWQAALTAINNSSSESMPLFASSTDLHLVNDFNANNNALNLGVSTDIDGNSRPLGGGYDIGADEFILTLPPLDLSVNQVVSPTLPICAGTYPVLLEVQNQGISVIDSVNIWFSVNGSPAVNIPIGGLSLATAEIDTLNLGTFTYNNGVIYNFTLYSLNPNGGNDTTLSNDTLIYNGIQTSLNGVYTINATLPASATNYQSFASVASDLNLFGVCGPVTFNVAAGTYNENIHFLNIPGVSTTNTVSFVGAGALTTKLTHDGSVSQATWRMEGSDHINISHMTVETTKTTADAWGIHFSNGCDSIFIDSCRFITPVTTTTDIMGIVASGSLTAETTEGDNVQYLTVLNSYFRGGESGIHIEGNGVTYSKGITISGNTFRQHDDQAFETDNLEDLILTNNDVDSITISGADGFYLVDVNNFVISGNKIHVNDFGLYVEDGNEGYTVTSNSKIINNMIISDSDYGMDIIDCEFVNIYHNTSVGSPGIAINDQINYDVRNNIFVGIGDYAFESVDTLTFNDIVDYNLYYSTGTNTIYENTAINNLSTWLSASPSYNANSVEGDPIFVAANDLHVIGGLAYNSGDNSVGVFVDIDGDIRPMASTVDMGADEFTPNLNDLGVSLLVSPIGSACEDSVTYFEFVIQNLGLNDQDTVSIHINLNGNSNISFADTIITTIGGFSIDTLLFGPINTDGLGIASFTAYTTLLGDLFNSNDTITGTIEFNTLAAAPTVLGDTICSGDTALLVASSVPGNLIRWYYANDLSTSIHEGDSLELAATSNTLIATTSASSTNSLVGPASKNIGSNANFSSLTAQNMTFETFGNIIIDSITVFPQDTGTIDIQLKTSSGTVLQTITKFVQPAVAGDSLRIDLGMEVSGPGSYMLGAGSGSTCGGLFRNSTGASYPYEIPGVVSITGNTFSTAYYYYYYNWRVTYNGCESYPTFTELMVDSINVVLPNDTSICEGSSIEIAPLNANSNMVTYTWHDSSNDTTYNAASGENVSLIVTSILGCTASDSMVIGTISNPIVDLGNDTSYCAESGIFLTLDAGNGSAYNWSTNENTQTINVNASGNISVTVTSAEGCFGEDTISIFELPTPNVDAGDNIDWCEGQSIPLPADNGNGIAFIWTDSNGTVVTTVDYPGVYFAYGTDTNGCGASDSLIATNCVGIGELTAEKVSVYPNPTNGNFNIVFENNQSKIEVEVVSALGAVVVVSNSTNTRQISIDLTNVESGLYFVRINTDSASLTTNVIKQ